MISKALREAHEGVEDKLIEMASLLAGAYALHDSVDWPEGTLPGATHVLSLIIMSEDMVKQLKELHTVEWRAYCAGAIEPPS